MVKASVIRRQLPNKTETNSLRQTHDIETINKLIVTARSGNRFAIDKLSKLRKSLRQ